MNTRSRVRTVARIVGMLRVVPPAPGPDHAVSHRRRPAVVVIFVTGAVAALAFRSGAGGHG